MIAKSELFPYECQAVVENIGQSQKSAWDSRRPSCSPVCLFLFTLATLSAIPGTALAFDWETADAVARGLVGGVMLAVLALVVWIYQAVWTWLARDENSKVRKVTKAYLLISIPAIFAYGIGLLMLFFWPIVPGVAIGIRWVKE